LKIGEQVVQVWFNIRLTHSSIHTVLDNADRNKENSDCVDSMKCQQGVFVRQDYNNAIIMKHAKNYECESLTFYCLRINKYIV
jgi:hypothetical protein